MSEKLLTPLDVMPPALRQLVESILKKHLPTSRNPSTANSTKLAKRLEVLENLWAELHWEHSISDLQQRRQNLQQRIEQRMTLLQPRLPKLRQKYAARLQKRRQKLSAKRERWEQKKQTWRNALKASRHDLAAKQQLLTLPLNELIEHRIRESEAELQHATASYNEQAMLLQQVENNGNTSLQRKKRSLTSAFTALQHSLKQMQDQAPQQLRQLQQQTAQRRHDFCALVSTWKNAATERETRLLAELEVWNKRHPMLSAALPSWDDLEASWQQLSAYKQTLTEQSQQLWQRKQRLSSAEQTMQTEWQRVSSKPSWSGLRSEGQRTDWLKSSLPLRRIWRDLFPCMIACAQLKKELLSGGFLAPDEYPEIDLAWAAVELRW
jgi:hypothetical protein